jgi:hypothetical protein
VWLAVSESKGDNSMWGWAMSRFLCSLVVVVAVVTMTATPANAAPDEDFVVGNGAILITDPGGHPLQFDIVIDAHSDPSGGNPSGNFALIIGVPGSGFFGGAVTCLQVMDNTAIIGFNDDLSGPSRAQVVDNSATGAPDTIGVRFDQVPDCSEASFIAIPLISGDIVVHDAVPLTSKDQCKDGGWRDFTDDEGNPFKNQGECIAFVQQAA